jgi:hypothetical protein
LVNTANEHRFTVQIQLLQEVGCVDFHKLPFIYIYIYT